VPTTSQLELGEIAINTADGKLYFKRYDPVANTESIVDMSADLDANAILDLLKGVDGPGSGLDADLLDGQDGSYYLDYNNFTNVPPATLDLTLTGKVTGNAFSNTGVMTLITELANTGVTAGTYGSASLVPVITVDEDGRITSANTVSVAGVANTYWTSSNNTFTIETADGGIFNTVIDEFTGLTVNGDIVVTGLVDGRDIAADGLILDTLSSATTTVNLTGKVTGSAVSNNGIVDITTELANTGVVAGTYGSPTQIPVLTIDEDGRITVANTSAVAGVEDFFFEDANNTITLETGDGTIYYARINKLDRIEEDLTVTLEGKVTGTVTSNTGILTVQTELANTGVVAGTYGSSTSIPVLTIDEDGRITVANTASVSGVEDLYWVSSNNSLILQTGDGTEYIALINAFTDITANTINGRDITADGDKLDGIEDGAQVNPSNTEILESIKTVDGAGSGLDADLLDGQHASDIIATAVGQSGASVGNGLVQISSGSGLTGSGSFNLNDFSNTSITIAHADTSSVANTSLSLPNVVTGLTFDTFGHVQSVSSSDLDTRYYTETEIDDNFYTKTQLDNGQLDNRYYTETELNNGQLDNRYYTETELNNGQLDTRYYTETEADNRFVNVTGDTMSGELIVNANISQDHSTFISSSTTTITTSQTPIYAFPFAAFSAAEIIITASEASNRHVTKLLITHDGSTAIATEYGTVFTNSELATYDIAINGPVLQLLGTAASSSSTVFKIVGTLIKV
jgi:PAS domain-containing protein